MSTQFTDARLDELIEFALPQGYEDSDAYCDEDRDIAAALVQFKRLRSSAGAREVPDWIDGAISQLSCGNWEINCECGRCNERREAQLWRDAYSKGIPPEPLPPLAERDALGYPSEPEAVQVDEGELWSFLRRVIEQGRSIEADNQDGQYPSYEHLSARIDEAAKERVPQLLALLPKSSGEPGTKPVPDSLISRTVEFLGGWRDQGPQCECEPYGHSCGWPDLRALADNWRALTKSAIQSEKRDKHG